MRARVMFAVELVAFVVLAGGARGPDQVVWWVAVGFGLVVAERFIDIAKECLDPPAPKMCTNTTDHGAADPCTHCGHPTDLVCPRCYASGEKRRDVCLCCTAIHENVVHAAAGKLQ